MNKCNSSSVELKQNLIDMKEIILKELVKNRSLDTCNEFVLWAEMSDLEFLADKIEKAITVTQCCTQLKDEVKLTFDEYTEKFYISNGFTYESKRTGKLVDINEITERYRWYSKNL